jgi:hypothetical protein
VRVFYDVGRALYAQYYPNSQFANQLNSLRQKELLDLAARGVKGKGLDLQFAGDETVPLWLAGTYLAANITLNCLNFYWFGKMIETIRKRFDPPFGTRGVGEKDKGPARKRAVSVPESERTVVEGIDVDTDQEGAEEEDAEEKKLDGETVLARGIYGDGRRTVEVEKTEIRQRK